MRELKRAIKEHKNCPCCDSENIGVGGVVVLFGEDIFIKCKSCGLKLQICKEYGWEELLKRWNTRKPMDRIVERLGEEQALASKEKCRCVSERNMLQYDMAKGYENGICKAIEIVKEEGGMNE